jgi:hypothetical protein
MTGNSNWARWGFKLFGLALIVINAALTFAFGYSYLGAAFGQGPIADYMGAFYALLLFDFGYLAWFFVYIRAAESTGQRSIAIGLTVFSLLGSLAATLQQLATNATALVDLREYHEAVGYVALGAMLLMTAGHIVSTAAYFLLDPREKVKQRMAEIKATLLDDSLDKAEKQIQIDQDQLIQHMSEDVRLDILDQLGFTHNLKPIKQAVLPPVQQQPLEQPLSVNGHDSVNFTHRQDGR